MKADLIVQNARIVAQTGVFVGWLAVQDGRIAALGEGPAPGPAKTVLDGTGQVLLPGAIDTHPTFLTPGLNGGRTCAAAPRRRPAAAIPPFWICPTPPRR